MKPKRIVLALGGNALGENLPEQMKAVKRTVKTIADLLEEGHQMVITHGNGPQVGMINMAMTMLSRGIESELGGVVQETTWSVEGDELVFHLGKPGRAFDLSTVKSGILAHFSSGDTTPLELTAETTDPAAVDLEQVHSEVCTEVSNASLDPETFEITPSVTGLDFEISTASAALEGAAWGSDVSVPLAVTEPTVSTESLRDLLFRDVLGSATSKVGGSANRKSNVALAASTFNGRILLPAACRSGPTPLRARRRRWSPRPPYLPLRSKPQSARREKPRPRRQSEYAFCFPCRLPFQQNSLLSDLRPTFRLCHDHNLPQSDSKRNPFFPGYGKIFLQCCLKDTKVPPKRKRIKRIDQGLALERLVDF